MTSYKLYYPVALCLCVAALAFTGCPSTKSQHKSQDTVAAKYPRPWSLTISSGGGYTGIYTGYTLGSDGRAQYWRKDKDSVQTSITVSDDMVEYIYRQLEAVRFRSQTLNAPSNLTYQMELREGDSTHMVQWGGEAKDVPEGLQSLYTGLNNFMRGRFVTK